jgi:hypothetical protein
VPIAPPATIVGAPRLPLPYGLFSTFTFRSGDRFEGGVQWERQICDPAGGIGAPSCPPDPPTIGLPKSLDRNGQGSGEATPFIVYGHFTCSPTGYSLSDAQDKANEHLLTREQQRAERAFWTGDLGNTPFLANPDTDETAVLNGGVAVSLRQALSMLENYIAVEYGSLGVIHMTRGTAELAAGANLIEASGGRLLTKVGTPVAAGAGYPGTGPAGGNPVVGKPWAYVTPAVFGYRSEVFTSSNTPGDLFDRRTNELMAIAERSYLLGFDDCGVAAVPIDLAL